MNDGRRDNLQSRLDELSRQVRWQRRDGDDRYGNRDNISGDRSDYNGNAIGNRDDRFSTQYDARAATATTRATAAASIVVQMVDIPANETMARPA